MLNGEKIQELLDDCLFREDEVVNGVPVVEPIYVNGIVNNLGLHPTRTIEKRPELLKMLNELPESFWNGDSFLNLCQDKNGKLWTGLQRISEAFLILCIANNLMKYVFPRETWSNLPGSVPFVIITMEAKNEM